MDAGARGDGSEENQWGGEIEVVIAWQTCLDGRKKEDCMQVQEEERQNQQRKGMKIVHVCQEILKLLTAGTGVKGGNEGGVTRALLSDTTAASSKGAIMNFWAFTFSRKRRKMVPSKLAWLCMESL